MRKTKLAICALGAASSMAIASDFQVGYVNIDRIFAEAKPAKEIQQALKDKYSSQQQNLQTLNTQLRNEQSQIQTLAAKAPSFEQLTAADQTQLQTLQSKYQTDQASFQQQYIGFEHNLQKTQELALSMLMTRTNDILKTLSDKNGYDLVVTSNQVIYAKSKYDITNQVIVQLNTMKTDDIIKQINSTPSTSK